MTTKSFSNRTVPLAFASAVLALLVVGAIAYRAMGISRESDRWVRHSHTVLESLQTLAFATESMKSGHAGFVLFGRDSYLEAHRTSRLEAEHATATLRDLTKDNPEQQRRLLALAGLAAQQIQYADMAIGLRRTQGFESAMEALRDGRSRQIADDYRRIARQAQDDERRLLGLRAMEARRRLTQASTALVFATALGLLITGAAAWNVHRDSTRRGLAERALRDRDEAYRILLDGVKDYAIFMLDPRGTFLSWNAGAERITGYKPDEIIGQTTSCFYSPEEIKLGKPEQMLRQTAANGRHEEQGMRVRKDGSPFQTSVTLTALRDEAGALLGFSGISRDLSENTDSGAKYRGLLEAAPDAMVVVNQGGDIVLLNVQAETQFGYHRDELLGQPVKNIIPEGFAERLVADGLRSPAAALAQQIGTGIELIARRKNGTEFPIELMLSPLESTEGILVTAAIRDIATRKEAEAHLLLKMEELNRSNEELGHFAYIASHDLQEPLRMVASYTQLLSRRYKSRLDADADEFIAFAVDGASRMQRLIQDLLAYSRVGTKGQDLLQTSSEDALQQALLNLRGAIKESGALVTHDPLPTLPADQLQLTQLFQNLIGNAIKYQKPGIPRIHVSATQNGGKTWTFSVQDNGLGIDSQYFEKIFGMFQRLHKREEFAGTGIGLAICKKIVERHGGSISVESQPGQGSTFRFALAGNGTTS